MCKREDMFLNPDWNFDKDNFLDIEYAVEEGYNRDYYYPSKF